MDDDGACWTVQNRDVRMSYNWTLGRLPPEQTAPEKPVRFPGPRTGSAA